MEIFISTENIQWAIRCKGFLRLGCLSLFLVSCSSVMPPQTQMEMFAATDELGHIPGAVGAAVDQFIGPKSTSSSGSEASSIKDAFDPATPAQQQTSPNAPSIPKAQVKRGDTYRVGARMVYTNSGPVGIKLRSSISLSQGGSRYSLPNGVSFVGTLPQGRFFRGRQVRVNLASPIRIVTASQTVELEQTLSRAFDVFGTVRAELGAGAGLAVVRTKTQINSVTLDIDHTGSQRLPYTILRLDVIGPADVRLRGEVRQYKNVGPSASLGMAARF